MGHTAITLEDCQDAWNELVDVDVTSDITGTDSFGNATVNLIAAAPLAAGYIMATEAITSKNLSTKTHIALWIKSTVALNAGDLQLLLDNTANCASPLESLNIPATSANVWVRHVIALAVPGSDTAIISVGLKQIVDKGAFTVYLDDIIALVCSTFTNVLSVRGIDEPGEDITYWNSIQQRLLDGSYVQKYGAFQRGPTVSFGYVSSKTQRLFLHTFFKADSQYLFYSNDEVQVVNANPEMLSNEWMGGFSSTRGFTLSFREKNSRTTTPVSWA